MAILVWGLSIFFAAITIHVIIWRIYPAARSMRSLFRLFFYVLILAICFVKLTASVSISFSRIAPESLSDYLHICLFFISLTLAYIISYSAVEAESPTVLIIDKVMKKGAAGLTRNELDNSLKDEILIEPRIKDLVNDKMVYSAGNRYKLTLKGRLFVTIFISYRNFLNLPKGG